MIEFLTKDCPVCKRMTPIVDSLVNQCDGKSVNIKQIEYDKIRSKNYNKNRKPLIAYNIGDLVLLNISRRLIGNQRNFTASWISPYEIIAIKDKIIKPVYKK